MKGTRYHRQVEIRVLRDTDSLAELTALIRAAYQQLADLGFRYWGTWQSEDDTRQRCSQGLCLVAEEEGRLVGTVLLKRVFDSGDPPLYHRPDVQVISQFAVHPSRQGGGIGSALLDAAERLAVETGATEVALDTAEGATHLIDLYERRGYSVVGSVDWGETNYVSVLMGKRL